MKSGLYDERVKLWNASKPKKVAQKITSVYRVVCEGKGYTGNLTAKEMAMQDARIGARLVVTSLKRDWDVNPRIVTEKIVEEKKSEDKTVSILVVEFNMEVVEEKIMKVKPTKEKKHGRKTRRSSRVVPNSSGNNNSFGVSNA